MALSNAAIAETLDKLADLLEIEGANPFRVRAYRNAARTVSGLSQSIVSALEEEKDLAELPYIGANLAAKIKTLTETGKLPLLEEVEQRTPARPSPSKSLWQSPVWELNGLPRSTGRLA